MEVEFIDAPSGRAVIVRLQGQLDTQGVDRTEARFNASVVAAGHDSLVDLSGLSVITSMGIRMLISAAKAANQRDKRMVLFGAQGVVHEALDSAALDTLIPTVPDLAQALAALTR